MSSFYFVSAPCGSGKTYQIINRAYELAKVERRVVILQPTKELIDKTVREELLQRPDPPTYKVFHGDTVSGSVAQQLTEYLKQTDDNGQIVFATHQVLPHIGFWANRETWDVFIDEAPQVHRHNSLRVPDTHKLITDLITLEPCNSVYSRVWVADKSALEQIAQNKGHDEIYDAFRELSQTLLNRHWHSFVNTEQFQRLKAGKQDQLSVHSVLMPSVLDGFGSVVFAAANFTDSMISRLWGANGAKFRENTSLASLLLFQEHQNGQLITINYADNGSWSKRRRLTKLNLGNDHEATVMDALVKAAKRTLPDQTFLWQANKNVPDTTFDSKGERLPNVPHGLNDFSQINNVVFLSSLNPSPDHFRFLKVQGIDGQEVRRAIYHEALYQSVMRTSIRNRSNIEPKTVIVPDISAARYLQSLFPNSRIEKLESDIPDAGEPKKVGRPREHQSDKDRKAKYRQRQKRKLLDELLQLKEGPYLLGEGLLDEEEAGRARDKIAIVESYTNFVSHPLTLTMYRGKYSNNPLGYLGCDNVDSFIFVLESWHKRRVESKESNYLLSPAIFDPNHPDREGNQKRGSKNIRYLRHIWLDFENGKLKPEEIAQLFPLNRLVIFNTYNHTADAPRFRVIFPTSQGLTPEAYEAIWDNIAAKLNDAGYWVRKTDLQTSKTLRPSGVDVGKRTAASPFYAPCQAKIAADSFFCHYNEPSRRLLDPRIWIENNVVQFPEPLIPQDQPFNDQRVVNQQKVAEATEEWRKSEHHKGDNDRFWRYALSLRTAGMSREQIEGKLHEEAKYGRLPDKRRRQIPWIMKSLQQPFRKAG